MELLKSPCIIEKIFGLKVHQTTVKKEILAGITTFITMAYILAVNPGILSETGMDNNALFAARTLSAVIGTLVMAFVAKYLLLWLREWDQTPFLPL